MEKLRKLRIVGGNDFYLMVPVRRIVFRSDEYGRRLPVGERMDLPECSVLGVNLIDECERKTKLPFTIKEGDDSELIVKFKGCRLDYGWYGIEVVGTYDGRRFRSYERNVFKIVENNGKSFVCGEQYAGEASYQIDTMWTLYAQESYPFFELDPVSMKLYQHGVVENGEMYLDEDGKLCMMVSDVL